MNDSDEFAAMSDPDFLAERGRVRETLEALTERYRLINIEFNQRAGISWAQAQVRTVALPRLLAVEVLLAEPEALGDDVLETCLYILRDRLQGNHDADV